MGIARKYVLAVVISVMSLASTSQSAPNEHPVRLFADHRETSVRLRVIGSSTTPLVALYKLGATSGTPGTNHSMQSGRAKVSSTPATYLDLTIETYPSCTWHAELTVELENGKIYNEALGSDKP